MLFNRTKWPVTSIAIAFDYRYHVLIEGYPRHVSLDFGSSGVQHTPAISQALFWSGPPIALSYAVSNLTLLNVVLKRLPYEVYIPRSTRVSGSQGEADDTLQRSLQIGLLPVYRSGRCAKSKTVMLFHNGASACASTCLLFTLACSLHLLFDSLLHYAS
jgi:hypothetical protein